MTKPSLIIGQTLGFCANPFHVPWDDAVVFDSRGGLLIQDGIIREIGTATDLRAAHPQADIVDMGDALLTAGFIDGHAHYPQTAMIASWGKRLIDWLNTYTFPEEMRFADPDYAKEVAATYFDLTLAAGTTTACSYATIHPASVTAYFEAAQSRGLRALAGKTCMDRNAPDGLRDTAQSAYDDSRALLQEWHGQERLSYVITPRFSPTSTPEQLEALGALWSEHPECLMQTHISEQTDEIAWVRDLFPNAQDYLDTYEQFGLLGARGAYGHAIHLDPREIARLREVGASVIHCPTSNMFIGSGLFDMTLANTHRVGLATDTGGGSSFSMLRTMAAAYEVAQLRGQALHPAQLMWLATKGSAEALHLPMIGNLSAGMEADIIAIDLKSTPAIAQRVRRSNDIWDALFPTIMMGDDRAIRQVWIAGKPVRSDA